MADLPLAGTPLLARNDPDDALARLIAGVARLQGTHAVLFRLVGDDAGFGQILRQAAARLGVAKPVVLEPFRRAALAAGPDFDGWFTDNFARKRRKEFRRLAARLAEQGTVEIVTRSRDEPLSPWIDDFLALEGAGWKGRRGTALACSRDAARFLAEALDRLNERGELLFWRLSLDGKPLAMLFAILSGGTAFLGKIAYDESFARYSPGVLLILEATRTLLGRPDILLRQFLCHSGTSDDRQHLARSPAGRRPADRCPRHAGAAVPGDRCRRTGPAAAARHRQVALSPPAERISPCP